MDITHVNFEPQDFFDEKLHEDRLLKDDQRIYKLMKEKEKYNEQMNKNSNIHAKTFSPLIGDHFIIKKRFDNNQKTKKRKLEPFNSDVVTLEVITGNNLFKLRDKNNKLITAKRSELKSVTKKIENVTMDPSKYCYICHDIHLVECNNIKEIKSKNLSLIQDLIVQLKSKTVSEYKYESIIEFRSFL